MKLCFYLLDLHAEAQASTKKQAESSCALSMIRQLFHKGQIDSAEKMATSSKRHKELEVRRISYASFNLAKVLFTAWI